jgi:adenylate cyclase class IV
MSSSTATSGRLKLRRFSDGSGELIFYRRLDTEGPARVGVLQTPTSDPAAMASTMRYSFRRSIGVVRKRRTLYLVGQTRDPPR